jgi:hypothetical protein
MNHHVIYIYPLVTTNVTHLETMFNNECHLWTSSVNPSWTDPTAIPQPSKTGFTRSSPTKCNPRWQCRSRRGAWEEISDPRKPRNNWYGDYTEKKDGTNNTNICVLHTVKSCRSVIFT